MKKVLKFDDKGNFILWKDDIGCGLYRQGAIPERIVQCLLWWVLDDGKDFGLFPMREIDRETWGAILAEFREIQHEPTTTFVVNTEV